MTASLSVEFCGEVTTLAQPEQYVVGREGQLAIEDNPYLHRRFLLFSFDHGLWWVANVGSRLSATLCDGHNRVQAWLGTGGRLPVVLPVTVVRFTAGPTSYELTAFLDEAPYAVWEPDSAPELGSTTLGRVTLNEEQALLVLALAEPTLRRGREGPVVLPTSQDAARRLGWPLTKFNRKLDFICEKLTRAGVRGLHGDSARLATSRRARLVEYALSARLIDEEDLSRLPV